MKKTIISMVVMAMFAVMPANAQGIAFGVKGGVNFTKMSIDNDAVNSESGVGFFIGPTLKIDFLPFLGIQGSVMYEQANSKVDGEKIKRQSIIVPIDLRVNLKLNEEAGIYLATGPQVGFNVGESDFSWNDTSTYKNTFQMKKSMFNWNFGAGAMLSTVSAFPRPVSWKQRLTRQRPITMNLSPSPEPGRFPQHISSKT